MHLFVGSFGGVSGAIGDMCDKYKNSTDAVFSVPVYISFCKYGHQIKSKHILDHIDLEN